MRDIVGWGPRLGLAVAMVFGAAGCGGSGTVSGKVTYKGEPLGRGTVVFVSPGKATVTAPIAADGSYSIPKVPAGRVKIAVETKSAKGAEPPQGMMPPRGANVPPEAKNSPLYGGQRPAGGKFVEIPKDYADPDKSNLTYTVTDGPQTHNIDLK
jgi:hypothetical protein